MPSNKVIAAIVARSTSPERPRGLLTDRALIPVAGQWALGHIVRRLKLCRNLGSVVLAVGSAQADFTIIEAGESLGLAVVAGHPHHVLRRLLQAVELEGAAHVVRINGNFPLIDPWALDNLIKSHLNTNADYSTNGHYRGLVYGLGAEIISADVLKEMVNYGQPGEAHSGTRFFPRHPQDFDLNMMDATILAPQFKACLDFAGDEKVVEAILKDCPEPDNEQVIKFLSAHPSLIRRENNPAEVSLSKVLLFHRKLGALLDSGPQGFDTTYPVSVELSLTNQCNQKCCWCSDADLRQRSPDQLNEYILEQLFADLAQGGTKGVTIEGGGEPTLSPLFNETITLAKQHGLAVGLITNGLKLFQHDPTLFAHFEWIRVSLDAAHQQQYKTTKGVDGFDQVMDNLARLVKVAPKTILGVGYVLTRQNDDPNQLQHLALSLRAMGLDYLQIRPVVDHPHLNSQINPGFLKKFETPAFSINLAGLTDNQAHGNLGWPCRAHSLSTVIGADGAVWLCGRLNPNPKSKPLGYLTKQKFKDIWLGTQRINQSKQVASGKFCQTNCPQCRMTKYNQLLAEISQLKTRNFI